MAFVYEGVEGRTVHYQEQVIARSPEVKHTSPFSRVNCGTRAVRCSCWPMLKEESPKRLKKGGKTVGDAGNARAQEGFSLNDTATDERHSHKH